MDQIYHLVEEVNFIFHLYDLRSCFNFNVAFLFDCLFYYRFSGESVKYHKFIWAYLFISVDCVPPQTTNGLTVSALFRLIENIWVEGDNISYICTGDGETDDDVISICEDDGEWSLETLPSCCKFRAIKGFEWMN